MTIGPQPAAVGAAIVVGAGLGGLTAALALLRAGWRVRVYEQAPALGEVGAGITLSPGAARGLAWQRPACRYPRRCGCPR